MGKVDDMRKMREERFASMQKTSSSFQASARSKALDDTREAPLTDELCGHRAISGKSCTRPKDHSEKNHRYTS